MNDLQLCGVGANDIHRAAFIILTVLSIELYTCIIHVAVQLLYINWQHKPYTKCSCTLV